MPSVVIPRAMMPHRRRIRIGYLIFCVSDVALGPVPSRSEWVREQEPQLAGCCNEAPTHHWP